MNPSGYMIGDLEQLMLPTPPLTVDRGLEIIRPPNSVAQFELQYRPTDSTIFNSQNIDPTARPITGNHNDEAKVDEFYAVPATISPFSFGGNDPICVFHATEWETSVNETCVKCSESIENPSVTLLCSCKYHLNCFKTIEKSNVCVGCKDSIIKKSDEDYQTCSICLEPIKKNLLKLPCNHFFHGDCINQWSHRFEQQNRKNCPMCRKPY